MAKKETVKEAVEETPVAESAPAEAEAKEGKAEVTTPDDSAKPEAPVKEPEEQVSETVPEESLSPKANERIRALANENRALREQLQQQGAPAGVGAAVPEQSGAMSNTYFDPETSQALDTWYVQRREAEKEAEFRQKHQDDLKDPVLAGTTQRLIAEANARNEYMPQEDALSQAKKLVEARVNPQVQAANKEGFTEGEEIARKKQVASAIGDTGSKAPQVDESKMTAKEYAEHHSLPRQ